VKRLPRILFNLATLLSLALCLASAGLWIAARMDYHWSYRYGPADGRVLSIRSEPRNRERFRITFLGPWPHPPLSACSWSRTPLAGRPGGTTVQIGNDPSGTIRLNDWDGPGLHFSRSRATVVVNAPQAEPMLYETPIINWSLLLAYWVPATLFGLPVLARVAGAGFGRDRRRRLLREHRCLGCGYDLRATPDRCPECGAVPQVKT
jgi:hypothetical protein